MNSLRGKRVVITRPAMQGENFISALNSLGATPLHIPVIKVTATDNINEVNSVLDFLGTYSWIIFTSSNGVRFFVDKIRSPKEMEVLKSCRLAAVGKATAETLESLVRAPDAVPPEFVSDAIAAQLGDLVEKKVLLARAVQVRKVLAEDLNGMGAEVTELPLYNVETCLTPELEAFVKTQAKPDFLTFSSSSTVRAMHELLKRADKNWFCEVPSVCIGPVTAQTLRDFGIEPFAVASEYSVGGMLEALRGCSAD